MMMKKLLITSLILAASVASLYAGSVTLAWDPSPGTNVIAYYSVYYVKGTNTVFATNNVNALGKVSVTNQTTCTISNLASGAYTFAATATDTNLLESLNSNTVWTNVPVNGPVNLRLTGATP
jgi:hypothetical protein